MYANDLSHNSKFALGRRLNLRQRLQPAGLRGVHDDGARGLVPAAAQRLIHHHLAHHAVHLCARLRVRGCCNWQQPHLTAVCCAHTVWG